jgi:hypothetical protein
VPGNFSKGVLASKTKPNLSKWRGGVVLRIAVPPICKEASAIRREGKIPLLIFLLADADTMVTATIAVPYPTLH